MFYFPDFLDLALQYSSSDNFSNIFTGILPKIYFILGGNKFNPGKLKDSQKKSLITNMKRQQNIPKTILHKEDTG